MNAPDDAPRDWRWRDAPDPDPAAALARAIAERDDARRERDRLARRLQAVGAIARGAPYRLVPELDAGDPPA